MEKVGLREFFKTEKIIGCFQVDENDFIEKGKIVDDGGVWTGVGIVRIMFLSR